MKRFFMVSIFIILTSSTLIKSQQFGFRVDKGIIQSDEIREASGIAVSRKNPGIFWTHNDSGDKSKIYAFDSLGNNLASFLLAGVQNRDWEDICIGPGKISGEQYIYIGDIGDNSLRHNKKYIYRIVEPNVSLGQSPIDTVVAGVERLVFEYSNGKRNAETLMLDPISFDIYIVSKEENTNVYRIAYPYTFYSSPTFNFDTAKVVATLPFKTAVGGDISADGKEILIKKRNIIYYWEKEDSETIVDVLQKLPTTVPYFKEAQGEAVCWAGDLSGYYTISEGVHPHLYFYPRLVTSVEQKNNLPDEFELYQNYPNPFNPTTTIKYSIPNVGNENPRSLHLIIYDILGREVTTLVNKEQNTGSYEIKFDANKLASGLYFYKLKTKEFTQIKKMILLR